MLRPFGFRCGPALPEPVEVLATIPLGDSLKIIGRVFASDAEVAANPRARSAVMRVAERIAP